MTHISRIVSLLATIVVVSSCDGPSPADPPIARKIPHDVSLHDEPRTDNYYRLRDDSRSRPEVLNYLSAENDYLASVMHHTRALQATLVREMTSRLVSEDESQAYLLCAKES